MSQTPRITETTNYKRLENLHPELKYDKDLRRKFRDYLSNMERHDQMKPTTYDEFEWAYKNFAR